jgi:PAS domain S-box-containing protein
VFGDTLIITDARNHPFFRNNLAVRDLSVIAYLGIPLVSSDSHVLGSFCVIDTKPHLWSEEDVETVRDLASAVMTEIDLRTQMAERKKAEEDRDELSALYASLQDEAKACKRAEASLREALLRQNEAVRSAHVGLWDWDFINNKIHYSIEWKKQIGYEEHEISNDFKEWERRVHPEDLEQALEIIQHCTAGLSKNYESEFRLLHKNGSYRWILAQGSVIFDETGHPAKIMGGPP